MKRTYKEIAKAILSALSNGEEHAYGYLERKVNTNWKTIRDHVDYMKLFGAVEISKENKIKITNFGKDIFRRS